MTEAPLQAALPQPAPPAIQPQALWAVRLLALMLLALGGTVLLGWALDIPAVQALQPGLVPMRPRAAAGFVLCGGALLALSSEVRALQHLARVLGALVALLALAVLLQDALGVDWGVGRRVMALDNAPGAAAGRPVLVAAWCFVLCGAALAAGRSRLGERGAQLCTLGAGFLALLALVGYLFDVEVLYHLGAYRGMALSTALGVLGLAAGLLLVRQPRHGKRRAPGLVATLALAVLVAVGWIVSDRLHSLLDADRWENRTELGLHELDRLFASLVDAESALYAYVLTQDPVHLELLERAVLSTQGRLESARLLLQNQPAEQQQRLAQLDAPIQEELRRLQASAELMRTQGFDAARQDVRQTWQDKAHVLGIRQQIGELQRQQQRLLEQRVAVKQDDIRRAQRTLVGGGAFGTLLLLGILALLWHENARRRASEVELALRRDEAEAASRAKSAFLANMSHEIRTPMNAILGLTHLLQRDAPTQQQSARLASIDGAGRHLLGIINDVLNLSKIEAGKLRLEERDFSLPALLEQVRTLVAEPAAAKRLGLYIATEDIPTWLRGDDTRLRQALLNYAGNAVKFTARGRVTLRAKLLEQRGQRVLLRFEVEDTGVGVDPSTLPRLFEAFEQADRSTTRKHGGTGLGLAITRRLAALMGGEAGAQPRSGGGSVFWFTAWLGLGRPLQSAEAAQLPDDAELRRRFAGTRVLLAEDNAINREVALELLHGAGLVVDVVEDGEAALHHLQQQPCDLVLMDMQMPVLDGLQATRALRAQPALAALPVIALTANAFDEDRAECLAAGMNDFIAKPVDARALYATLLKWLPQPPEGAAAAAPAPGPAVPGASDALLQRLAGLPGLDLAGALARLPGLEHRYGALLRLFAGHHAGDDARIAQRLAQQDFEGARFLAHALKGPASSLGATALAEAASALEARLREGCTDAALLQPLAEVLRRHLQALVAAVGEVAQEA